MTIAVLSGKGGAGKTFTAVNLAATAQNAVYIDCDVEEPNGYLFFKPQSVSETPVYTILPSFDAEKCNGCRRCVDFCKFNALAFLREKPMLFPEVCHACGGCQMVCPMDAISEAKREIGKVEIGKHKGVTTITGKMHLGEASGIPIIKKALEIGKAKIDAENVPLIIDCPPGSACSVMESMEKADYCILVVEPTAFGFHNFLMVYELTRVLKKPCGIVINKADDPYPPLDDFCNRESIEVLLQIPYDSRIATLCSNGKIAVEEDNTIKNSFDTLYEKVRRATL